MRDGINRTVLKVAILGLGRLLPQYRNCVGRTPSCRLKEKVEYRSVSVSTSTEGWPRSIVIVVL